MDVLEHVDQFSLDLGVFDTQLLFTLLNGAFSDSQKSLFGPFTEPVQSTTIDQRRELSQSGSEQIGQLTHTNDKMHISLHSLDITTEDVHLVGLHVAFYAVHLTSLLDLFHVLFLVDVGDISRVKDVVDVLEHLFVDDLGVHEEETDGFVIHTSHHQTLLDVLAPGTHVVVLHHFDLEDLVVHDEGSHLTQRLTSGSAHSQNQGVALGLADDTGNTGNVFTSIQEHDQFHLFLVAAHVLRVGIVVVLETLHLVQQLGEVLDLAVLTGVRVTSVQEVGVDDTFLVHHFFFGQLE